MLHTLQENNISFIAFCLMPSCSFVLSTCADNRPAVLNVFSQTLYVNSSLLFRNHVDVHSSTVRLQLVSNADGTSIYTLCSPAHAPLETTLQLIKLFLFSLPARAVVLQHFVHVKRTVSTQVVVTRRCNASVQPFSAVCTRVTGQRDDATRQSIGS